MWLGIKNVFRVNDMNSLIKSSTTNLWLLKGKKPNIICVFILNNRNSKQISDIPILNSAKGQNWQNNMVNNTDPTKKKKKKEKKNNLWVNPDARGW